MNCERHFHLPMISSRDWSVVSKKCRPLLTCDRSDYYEIRSMIDTILLFTELSCCVEIRLEVCLDGRGVRVLLVLRQSSWLIALETGHGPMEFLTCACKLALGLLKDINILWVDLNECNHTVGVFLVSRSVFLK